MYSSYKVLIEKLERDNQEIISYVKTDRKLAPGILLYRVILVDGRVRDEEVELFREISEDYLEISEDELSGFEDTVRQMATSSDVFEQFVGEMQLLTQKQKQEILTFMQDISISDREFHELEVNLVSQVKALLNSEPNKT